MKYVVYYAVLNRFVVIYTVSVIHPDCQVKIYIPLKCLFFASQKTNAPINFLYYPLQCHDILSVWIISIKDWHDAPFLVSELLSCWLAIQLAIISFLSYIFLICWFYRIMEWLIVSKAWILIWHDLVVKIFSFNRLCIEKACVASIRDSLHICCSDLLSLVYWSSRL